MQPPNSGIKRPWIGITSIPFRIGTKKNILENKINLTADSNNLRKWYSHIDTINNKQHSTVTRHDFYFDNKNRLEGVVSAVEFDSITISQPIKYFKNTLEKDYPLITYLTEQEIITDSTGNRNYKHYESSSYLYVGKPRPAFYYSIQKVFNPRKSILPRRTRMYNNNPYQGKDTSLIRVISQVQPDSVKVFHFNSRRIDLDFSPNTTSFVRYRDSVLSYFKNSQHGGKRITDEEIKTLLKFIKNRHKDNYGSDPVSPYEPTTGIVFYKKDVVKAHLDISLTTNKMRFEIVNNDESVYKYDWAVIGDKLSNFLKILEERYP